MNEDITTLRDMLREWLSASPDDSESAVWWLVISAAAIAGGLLGLGIVGWSLAIIFMTTAGVSIGIGIGFLLSEFTIVRCRDDDPSAQPLVISRYSLPIDAKTGVPVPRSPSRPLSWHG